MSYGDTPYLSIFSQNAGKCGKNADQNNSEYGLFSRNAFVHQILFKDEANN